MNLLLPICTRPCRLSAVVSVPVLVNGLFIGVLVDGAPPGAPVS